MDSRKRSRRGPGRPKGTRNPLDWRHKHAAFRMIWFGGRETREEIAESVGVSRMALWKWTQRDDFQRLLDKEYRDMKRAYTSRKRR